MVKISDIRIRDYPVGLYPREFKMMIEGDANVIEIEGRYFLGDGTKEYVHTEIIELKYIEEDKAEKANRMRKVWER
jgi:hypothetical protein